MERYREARMRQREKIGLMTLAFVVLLFLSPAFVFAQTEALGLEGVPDFIFKPPKTYHVEGLDKGATILVDKWGIPHIYGLTNEDTFFGQGFNAARDRLWQLDQWRRQGEGKLAEAFGERFLEQDKAARLFLYRGDLDKELKSYHPQGKKIFQAFVDGINAYIDLTRKNPKLLPLEFQLTCSTPGYWTIRSPLIRIFGLTRNISSEVRYAQLVNLMGADAVEKLVLFEPPTKLEVPAGVDLSLINNNVLTNYRLARAGVTFKPEDLAICDQTLLPDERAQFAKRLLQPAPGESPDELQPIFASNNWTISGKLTETGRPILANDPHRAQSVPSLRYIAHLIGPDWNAMGGGEPAAPGISFGHNERIANGGTIFAFSDEEDLYVYDTNPANPSQYLYKGKWENMKTVQETFEIRGKSPLTAQLKFTRHGPVIYEDIPNKKAYAVRAAYLEHEGTAVYLASLRINQARNWDDFKEAMLYHYCPSLNMIYADKDGNIGWYGGALAALRPNWSGLLPVPGNGDYEWDGFLNTKKLPKVFNPKQGFFATANQYNVPPDYAHLDVSAHEWTDPYRFNRVVEVLSAAKKHSVEDSEKLEYDNLSLPAEELVPLLRGLSSADPDVKKALNRLLNWNYVLSKNSVPASIYELWVQQLKTNVRNLYVPLNARSVFGTLNQRVLFRLLSSPDSAFGSDPIAGRNDVLLQSLGEALARLQELLGPDMKYWEWGNLHHMTYVHALSPAVGEYLQEELNVGPLPQSGDSYTVHNTGYGSDFNQNTGHSYRQIFDFKNFDRSVGMNSPGQSGDPKSRHYDDLFPLWNTGKSVPFYFGFDNILGATKEVVILRPKKN